MGECVHFNCIRHLVYMRTFLVAFLAMASILHTSTLSTKPD